MAGGVSSCGEYRSLIGASGSGVLLSSSWCWGRGGWRLWSVAMGGRGGGAENVKKYAENAMTIKSERSSFILKGFCKHEDKNFRDSYIELSRTLVTIKTWIQTKEVFRAKYSKRNLNVILTTYKETTSKCDDILTHVYWLVFMWQPLHRKETKISIILFNKYCTCKPWGVY